MQLIEFYVIQLAKQTLYHMAGAFFLLLALYRHAQIPFEGIDGS